MKKAKVTGARGPNRRTFLAGAALGGPSAVGFGSAALARPSAIGRPTFNAAPASAQRDAAAEIAQAEAAGAAAKINSPGSVPPITVSDPGSDFMVDVIKTLDLDFVALNPGGSTRGLHESIIHYGGNSKPSLIAVNHEEIGVAIAHGYARRRQTHGRADLRRARPPARLDGDLQRLCRSRSDHDVRRQRGRPEQALRAAILVSQRD